MEQKSAGKDVRTTDPVTTAAPETPAPSGKVGDLSDLHLQIEEYKLLVQIEELKAKLRDLKQPKMPAPAAPLSLPIAALTPPSGAVSPPVAQVASKRVDPAVLSVQGVDGELTATIRSGGKQITVRKGQKFGNGVISEISRTAVTVRNGKQTVTLPFE